jgi:enoyl-CoA hydratase
MTPRLDVRTEQRDGARIARVTVCNAGKLNILGSPLIQVLTDAFATLSSDASLRAVVLAGEGDRAFIGGADIAEMAELNMETARAFIVRLHRVCCCIRELPVPVVARLQGWTLGAGLEVAAACDLRIASQTARFGMPEVRVGIPSVIEAALLPQLIGWGRTRRLLLTGAAIDATTALAWGMVEEVAPSEQPDEAINAVLDAILAGCPRAIRQQKALIREWEELTLKAAIAQSVDYFAEAWRDPEPRAAMRRFLDRGR